MKSVFILASCFASALAAPAISWSPALAEFYSAIDAHVQEARQAKAVQPPSCTLSQAQMPVAPTPLPSPDPSWVLSSVVIGRGVQNYTCASASSTVIPKAVGAVANLYNVSCIANNYPDVLNQLPGLALQYPLPVQATANLQPSNLLLEGHHYFNSAGVPTFDLNASIQQKLGIGEFKKTASSPAPATAMKGQNGVGNGAVAWLYLTATSTTTNLAAVYRVNTAGGNPPADCSSSPAAFSVQYAAEYWFYTTKA